MTCVHDPLAVWQFLSVQRAAGKLALVDAAGQIIDARLWLDETNVRQLALPALPW